MQRSLAYTVILLLLALPAAAQQIITGKVLDGATGNPIGNASIYFNNTSIGTISGNDGTFSFDASELTTGELIVSALGFRTMLLNLTIALSLNKRYTIKLEPKENALPNLLVLSDATRKIYLKKFVENFLGITEEADKSIITNLSSIYFGTDSNPKVMVAYCDEPLEIINNRLGYKIYFQLIEFSFDDKNQSSTFYGYTKYESMGDKKIWVNNRRAVYFGSSLHFFRSLVKNRLKDENFAIFLLEQDADKVRLGLPKETDIAIPVAVEQIVIKDTSDLFYIAAWPGKLLVNYKYEPASKQYLSLKTSVAGDFPNGFKAYITARKQYVILNSQGIPEDPFSIYYSGYWLYEKAANLLPFDYYPDK